VRWRPDLSEPGTVLGPAKAWPENAETEVSQVRRPALTAPARGAPEQAQAGTKERPHGTNQCEMLLASISI
jgi:hypothetical protein